jgi:adenosylcobinamide-phosphate synthase
LTTALAVVLAVAADALLGEPARGHPLAAFGRLADAVERRWNRGSGRRGRGLAALAALVAVPAAAAAWLAALPGLGWVVAAGLLYLAIGARSLGEHAEAVALPLARGDLEGARQAAGRMVSRDTGALDHAGVARAGAESVLENGADAVFGALFWFVVAGVPGLVVYRLTNTLDAMWGYRSERLAAFGWAAARADDLLNWPVARLTAFTYALAGDFQRAMACWRDQGRLWKSPNAGPVMAAGAGALGVKLGGAASYHGAEEGRPELGSGPAPEAGDLRRAVALVRRGMIGWVLVIVLGGWLLA